jgi:hypothetical protein
MKEMNKPKIEGIKVEAAQLPAFCVDDHGLAKQL